jgi:hypothetical protein
LETQDGELILASYELDENILWSIADIEVFLYHLRAIRHTRKETDNDFRTELQSLYHDNIDQDHLLEESGLDKFTVEDQQKQDEEIRMIIEMADFIDEVV